MKARYIGPQCHSTVLGKELIPGEVFTGADKVVQFMCDNGLAEPVKSKKTESKSKRKRKS